MFGSAALEVAIAVIFIFMLFSLIVSALNELWLSRFDKRADFLAEAVAELLQDPDRVPFHHWNWFEKKKLPPSVARLYKHGLINALSRTKLGRPSYIGAVPFVAAILDFISPGETKTARTLAELKRGIEEIENPHLKESLVAILEEAGNDLQKFKEGIAAWFDRSMERVTGWYKRYAQSWLVILGLALAVGCNIDMIRIIHVLSTDPKLRSAIVANAAAYAEKKNADQTSPVSPDAARDEFRDAVAQLNQSRLPIGWNESARAYFYDNGKLHRDHALSAVFGWFITALAGSLGAPFWFDTLQRFINVRANGRAPDEHDLPTRKT
jgi:hypothetical protein